MRFSIGEKYVFFSAQVLTGWPFDIPKEEWQARYEYLFVPWAMELRSLDLLLLTCKEHAKVKVEFESHDFEKSCDGFIFEDETTGKRYFNQYPVANYSQISTESDWLVHQADDEPYEEWNKRYPEGHPERTQQLEAFYRMWQDVFHTLESIRKAIYSSKSSKNETSKTAYSLSNEKVGLLSEWLEQLKKAVEDFHGKKLTSTPHTFKFKDGTSKVVDFLHDWSWVD